MSQFHLSRFNRFNPRTPCGVRHAMLSCAGPCRRFQSTHSLRSATGYCWTRRQGLSVSIHALLAECDEICNDYKNQQYGFNPRTPCGVRLSDWFSPCPANQFQSTHSLRSATCFSGIRKTCRKVSIHALLAECDSLRMKQLVDVLAFQSTHSLRSATRSDGSPHPDHVVSIHALLAECDTAAWNRSGYLLGFNPRTPCGVRPGRSSCQNPNLQFQSTHSLRSATAPDLIHGYSTEQIILCANLPKKTVIARLLFLSIYLSIFYSQCITPIADLPGNSCELEVGAQAMFNSL